MIGKILELIGVSRDFAKKEGLNFRVGYTHKYAVVMESQFYEATNAFLCQVINPSDGIIISYDNHTAQAMAEENVQYYP